MTVDGRIGDGRYRLHEQLGSGGMGVVWRATDELLDRQVAIKRIRLDGDPAALTRQRMLREARIAARLHHPHIVTIFDVLTVQDEPWLVMEYLPSESLSDVLDRGALPPGQVAVIGVQIADALVAAHARGIVHRDVKPGNILLSRTGEIKLTDFGISRVAGDATLTSTGLITGTPAYLAPEVCRGEPGGNASDIYSLGATLYATVEGTPPFGDGHDNILQLIRRISAEQAPAPTRAGPLTSVLRHLLDNNPAVRPNALAAREMLRRIADLTTAAPARIIGPPSGPTPDWTAPQPDPPRPRRRRLLITGSIAAVLTITAALLIGLERGGGSDTADPPIPTPTTQAAPPPTTSPAPTAGSPAPTVGQIPADPRIADPCSLMDPVPLAAFGESTLDPDFGDFSECQVDVDPPNDEYVVVAAQFDSRLDPNGRLPGTREIRPDGLGIGRESESNGYCERTILLLDRTRILVSAELVAGAAVDTCAIAETATQTALTKLTTTGVGQRPAPDTPGSFALLDACLALDPPALTAAGIPAPTPTPGYANWSCRWGDTPSAEVDLRRIGEITANDGEPTTVAGRPALIKPGGYSASPDLCLVQVPHRRFLGSTGQQRAESLQIFYTGTGPPEELCRSATELATNAIPKLPPIQ
ncbi:MAG: protein kinase domain-containing protein [Pseudonocardia sp.]